MHTDRLAVSLFMAWSLPLAPSLSVLAQPVATRGVQDHTILFVCEHGSAKSIIAAAHFNDLAARTGSPYRAIARGLHPDTEIPAYVKSGLRAERLDIRGWQPKQFIERDALTADRVITLGCALPLSKAFAADKVRDWDIPPPIENYQNASRSIVERIALLLKELPSK